MDSIGSIRILETHNWTDCILKDSLFLLNKPNSNYIKIFVEPYNHYAGMKYFTDSKWLIRNHKIYPWRRGDGEFDRNHVLKKKRR